MLLDLPPEVRLQIYKHLIISPLPYIPLARTDDDWAFKEGDNLSRPEYSQWHPSFPRQLLLVCSQTYHEVRPLYFAHNGFLLVLMRKNEGLDYFISPSFADNRREIRRLRLKFARWGRNDWFVRELYPVLSDMILNGSLRDLDIQIVAKHLLEKEPPGSMKSGDGIRALRNLCEDPYLERLVVNGFWVDRSSKSPYLKKHDG